MRDSDHLTGTLRREYAAACAYRRLLAVGAAPCWRRAWDTGREHAPGNVAGAARFHASRGDRAAIARTTAQLPRIR